MRLLFLTAKSAYAWNKLFGISDLNETIKPEETYIIDTQFWFNNCGEFSNPAGFNQDNYELLMREDIREDNEGKKYPMNTVIAVPIACEESKTVKVRYAAEERREENRQAKILKYELKEENQKKKEQAHKAKLAADRLKKTEDKQNQLEISRRRKEENKKLKMERYQAQVAEKQQNQFDRFQAKSEEKSLKQQEKLEKQEKHHLQVAENQEKQKVREEHKLSNQKEKEKKREAYQQRVEENKQKQQDRKDHREANIEKNLIYYHEKVAKEFCKVFCSNDEEWMDVKCTMAYVLSWHNPIQHVMDKYWLCLEGKPVLQHCAEGSGFNMSDLVCVEGMTKDDMYPACKKSKKCSSTSKLPIGPNGSVGQPIGSTARPSLSTGLPEPNHEVSHKPTNDREKDKNRPKLKEEIKVKDDADAADYFNWNDDDVSDDKPKERKRRSIESEEIEDKMSNISDFAKNYKKCPDCWRKYQEKYGSPYDVYVCHDGSWKRQFDILTQSMKDNVHFNPYNHKVYENFAPQEKVRGCDH